MWSNGGLESKCILYTAFFWMLEMKRDSEPFTVAAAAIMSVLYSSPHYTIIFLFIVFLLKSGFSYRLHLEKAYNNNNKF